MTRAADPAREEPSETAGPPGRRPRVAGPFDLGMAAFFLVVWLLPMTWAGGVKKTVPFAGAWLQHQYRVACLFTHSQSRWTTYHVEVQHVGDGTWRELSMAGYFDMTVFGERSRLHRMLGQSYRKTKGEKRTDDIARWIRERYDRFHPDGPALGGLRFTAVHHGIAELARETSPFRTPALKETGKKPRYSFGEVRWDDRPAKHKGHGKAKPKKKRPSKPPEEAHR